MATRADREKQRERKKRKRIEERRASENKRPSIQRPSEPMATPRDPSNTLCTEHLPTSRQICTMLREAEVALKETERNPPDMLDSQGERLLQDIESLTYDVRKFFEEKNKGDLLQKIAIESELAIRDIKQSGTGLKGPDRKAAGHLEIQLKNIMASLRILGIESLVSRTFRHDMEEFLYVMSCISTDITGVDFTRITQPLHEMMLEEGTEHAKEKAKQMSEGIKQTVKKLREGGSEREVRPLTHEEEEELIERLRKVMVRISERPHSAKFLRGMFDMITIFSDKYHVKDEAERLKDTFSSNSHVNEMGNLLSQFLERFLGERTMKNMNKYGKQLNQISLRDSNIRDFFTRSREFFLDSLEEPKRWKTDPEITTEAHYLLKTGRDLVSRDDFRDSIRGLCRTFIKGMNNVMNDPDLHSLQRDSRQLLSDLVVDPNGEYIFNSNALSQLRYVLVASLIERMTVQLPGVAKETADLDYTVSNICVTLRDVVPESIKFDYDGNVALDTLDLKDIGVDDSHNLLFRVNDVQYHMTNIHFWFKRKKFPKLEDSGIVDVDIGGKGLNLDIKLNTRMNDGGDLYRVEYVKCKLDKLRVKLHETKRDFLYNLGIKLVKGRIKKKIERGIEEKITEGLKGLNAFVVDKSSHARSAGGNRMQQQLSKLAKKYLDGEAPAPRYEYPSKFEQSSSTRAEAEHA